MEMLYWVRNDIHFTWTETGQKIMEAVEMNSSIDSSLKELSQLEEDPRLTSPMKGQIKILQIHLGFLKMYIWCLDLWNLHNGSSIEAPLRKAEKSLYISGIAALDTREFKDWDFLVSNFLERVQLYKPEIKTNCLDFLDCKFNCKFTLSELQNFMECIVISLDNLVCMKADMFVDWKMQIEALKVKINLFSQLIDFSTKRCKSSKPIEALALRIQTWGYGVACLSILYWAEDGKEENAAAKSLVIFSDLLEKNKPRRPEVIGLFLDFLRTSGPSTSDIEQTGEMVVNFVDFLFENTAVHKNDGIQTLREGLIILIIFCMEKSRESKKRDRWSNCVFELTTALVHDADSFICSLSVDELKEGTLKERSKLRDFMIRINKEKKSFIYQQSYTPNLDSSSLNYPTTNLMGFIDLLLENLERMLEWKPISIPSIKHQFVILREELLSLRPFLPQQQKEYDEDSKLWTQIANMAYRAANAVHSFRYVHFCLWNLTIHFSDVTEKIKLIKSEVLKTRGPQKFNIRDVNAEMSSNLILPLPVNPSRIDEDVGFEDEVDIKAEMNSNLILPVPVNPLSIDEVVGFDDEAKTIIERLTHGSRELDIISIVGMAGQGKTTLAKKVYIDPSVEKHFHKRAWSCVSQSYECRRILMDILNGVTGTSYDGTQMAKEDLEERLKKSLKGQKYLVILDDIWDIKAWHDLKISFPDDRKGSRIMFTSRIQDIAQQAKSGCIPHPLNPLSDEESWTLLQLKMFHKKDCPPKFKKVGKRVAENCKGVPLAIVVIAGLLAKRVKSLDWWKQIAETLGSLAGDKWCMKIVELGYRHLPGYLKPCFLYLGVFEEDQEIKVQKLTRLWISEGLVQNSGMKNLVCVAKEYLMGLVTRSLVTVSSRSSTGGIKSCRIHDLLRTFCLLKGEKENFFKVTRHDGGVSNYPKGSTYKHYRVCIQTEWSAFLDSNPTGPFVHSLMVHSNQRFESHHMHNIDFRKFECLQVLDMKDIYCTTYKQFEVIASLVLLRYLAFWFSGYQEIPPSIVRLVNLETIYLRSKSEKFELPGDIWTWLRKLRHVDVTPNFRDKSISSGESSQLEDLQTFSNLYIDQEDEVEPLLRRMPRVRKLKFMLGTDAQFPELDFLSKLESLNVEYANWKKPYPGVINLPSTLKKLSLESFKLPWSAVSSIGKLPNLEALKLKYKACVGESWDVEDGEFSKLKFLKLYNLNLSHWSSSSDDAFHYLEELVVEVCENLRAIPSTFGNIFHLKRIKVRRCSYEVYQSARSIQEAQLDMGNQDFEVIIN